MNEEMFGRTGILDRLMELDNELFGRVRSDSRVPLVIVGSAALLLSNLADEGRLTSDIDFIEAPFEALGCMGPLDMNNAAETFLLRLPSGWRNRAITIELPTEVIIVSTPSFADLAIMKLDSGREQDLSDVREMLKRLPELPQEVDELLADPLEMQINLEPDEWESLSRNWNQVCEEAGIAHEGPDAGANASLSEERDGLSHRMREHALGRDGNHRAGQDCR